MAINKKTKKSLRPRANTGNTHHGMRYASDELFSKTNIRFFYLSVAGGFTTTQLIKYLLNIKTIVIGIGCFLCQSGSLHWGSGFAVRNTESFQGDIVRVK